MLRETQQLLYVGLGFVMSPSPPLDGEHRLGFQKALLESGIEPQKIQNDEQSMTVASAPPDPLQVRVEALAQAPVGRLMIIAQQPSRSSELVRKRADAVAGAFKEAWKDQPRQLLQGETTMRALFEASADHAFKELWESRLKQTEASLKSLQHPVLGGGLRFVMPPEGPDKPLVELKIESFLHDVKRFFVEVVFSWPTADSVGNDISPGLRISEVERYIKASVVPFMTGD